MLSLGSWIILTKFSTSRLFREQVFTRDSVCVTVSFALISTKFICMDKFTKLTQYSLLITTC